MSELQGPGFKEMPISDRDKNGESSEAGMKIRLNKFLSQAGIASRRESDKMIAEGRVSVNGEVVLVLGYKIDDSNDRIEVNGKRVTRQKDLIYLLMNKPKGCLVTLKDPLQRPTIMSLLPSLKSRVFPVGRLDFNSKGLLLLTNDGELSHRLMHPRYKIKKTYLVKIKGSIDPRNLTRLEKGIYLDGEKTAPAKVLRLAQTSKFTKLRIEIHEGRKREVRRMIEAIGHRVIELERIKFAGITMSNLKTGYWRYLAIREIDSLKKQVLLK